MRYMFLTVALVAVTALGALAAPQQGTLETGLGGNIHLSPEPTQISAQMHLLYYLNQVLGVGPYWTVQWMGEYESESVTTKPAIHYGLGAMAKFYLPVVMAQGKISPYVAAGFGMKSIFKEYKTSGNEREEQTESKAEVVFRVGFDWWFTDDWTIWVAYQGSKLFVDSDTYFDDFGNDLSDMRSDIRVGISTFFTK